MNWHTIKKGESLSKISKTFYGDFNQANIIARVNNIRDAGLIRVGMKLKIPQLKDHPFVNPAAADRIEHWTDTSNQVKQKIDPIMMYKQMGMRFFDQQDLDAAILEWNLVQKMDPKYKKVSQLLKKAKTIQKNIETIKQSE